MILKNEKVNTHEVLHMGKSGVADLHVGEVEDLQMGKVGPANHYVTVFIHFLIF